MSVENALHALRLNPRFMRHIVRWEHIPARPARYAPFPAALDDRLTAMLRNRGIEALYTHQAAAVEAALAGEHVAVATAAASGKTLCYNLPVLHRLLADANARALYLFPTKALAQDQLAELRALTALPLPPSPPLPCAAYDGDTPSAQRTKIRDGARIILSNPDMLHAGILPQHPRWTGFFANLRVVVIDEMHVYRGVFGSHVANVLRRLRRICQFYGSTPQFILASATIVNPGELAARLVEAPVTVIGPEQDGAPQGERNLLFYNPPLIDPHLGIRRSSSLEAADLAAHFLAHDVQTIVFAQSRLTTELILTYLRGENASHPPATIRGYRGGYLPAQRRDIEQGLRAGQVRGVVTTNALELGIDIGRLDAAVLTGYPGTVASARQQLGRAGRRQAASVGILVAGPAALDQYIVAHPGWLLGRSPEHARLNPDNEIILAGHLACAAAELPIGAGEEFGAAQPDRDIEATQPDPVTEAAQFDLATEAAHPVQETEAAHPERSRVGPRRSRRMRRGLQPRPHPSTALRTARRSFGFAQEPPAVLRSAQDASKVISRADAHAAPGATTGENLTPGPSPARRGEMRLPLPLQGRGSGRLGAISRAGCAQDHIFLIPDLLDDLVEAGQLYRSADRYFWGGAGSPAAALSLRSAGAARVLIQAPGSTGQPEVIGELERAGVPLLLYEGAIYLHEGATYLVERLDWEAGIAHVRPVAVDFYTRPIISEKIELLRMTAQRPQTAEPSPPSTASSQVTWGDVRVISQATGYKRLRRGTNEVLGFGQIDLPEQTLETQACRLTFAEPLIEKLKGAGEWLSDPNDYGPNWATQRQAARVRDGFRCQGCGVPEQNGRQHDVHHRIPFRAFVGDPMRREGLAADEAWRVANRLENLVTLCPTCHRRAEASVRTRTGLGGVAALLAGVAPLFLMCDPRDLGVVAEPQDPDTGLPTITIYEKTPGGVGYAEQLAASMPELLRAAHDVVTVCPCAQGCPACVGPVLEHEYALDAKALAQALLKAVIAEAF